MITLDKVGKWYCDFQALKDCSLQVDKGEIVAICGPSGSGKSTLIKTINGLEPFQQGRITVDGISVGDSQADLCKLRARIGMVFQSIELFPHLSVLENLTLAQIKVLGRSGEEAKEKALRLLDRLGLPDQKNKFPSQLSGGQQQRAAIARALAMDPVIMLLDEPTSALDPLASSEVRELMMESAAQGMTIVVITHEMDFARKLAHRIVFMDQGSIVEDAPKAVFFDNPQAARTREFLAKIMA
jgi:glutamate/aspartate transport system ATP-binding protein